MWQRIKKDKSEFDNLLKSAKKGDATAQFNLGIMYHNGEGVTQSYKEALAWYRKAAQQGNAAAQSNLGLMYENGQGVKQSNEEAVAWYRKAAEQGNATAQYNLGLKYENGQGVKQSDEEAIAWYQKATEQGYAKAQEAFNTLSKKVAISTITRRAQAGDREAQFNLGHKYFMGNDVTQNYPQAIYWWQLSANQGYPSAQYSLGWMYQSGKGLPLDYGAAASWYLAAALQGHVSAQYNYGLMCEYGHGLQVDKNVAIYWYQKAANQKHTDAQLKLDQLLNQQTTVVVIPTFANQSFSIIAPPPIEEKNQEKSESQEDKLEELCSLAYNYHTGKGQPLDQKKAFTIWEKCAFKKHVLSQFNLGMCYDTGQGVTQDQKQAVYWYQKAAEQGDASAQFNLGLCYANGQGVTQDQKQAVYWYQKAADQGHASAQFNLGLCYDNGRGVTQDQKQAVYWYEKAAKHGNADARFRLGCMYKNGLGITKNIEEANYWFKQAAELNHRLAKNELKPPYAGELLPRFSSELNALISKATANDSTAQREIVWRYDCVRRDEIGLMSDQEIQMAFNKRYKYLHAISPLSEQDYQNHMTPFAKLIDAQAKGDKVAEQALNKLRANYPLTLYGLEEIAPLAYSFTSIQFYKQQEQTVSPFINVYRKAEAGDMASQFQLGIIYMGGIGVWPDLEKANHWFSLAAKGGNLLADWLSNVATILEAGCSMSADNLAKQTAFSVVIPSLGTLSSSLVLLNEIDLLTRLQQSTKRIWKSRLIDNKFILDLKAMANALIIKFYNFNELTFQQLFSSIKTYHTLLAQINHLVPISLQYGNALSANSNHVSSEFSEYMFKNIIKIAKSLCKLHQLLQQTYSVPLPQSYEPNRKVAFKDINDAAQFIAELSPLLFWNDEKILGEAKKINAILANSTHHALDHHVIELDHGLWYDLSSDDPEKNLACLNLLFDSHNQTNKNNKTQPFLQRLTQSPTSDNNYATRQNVKKASNDSAVSPELPQLETEVNLALVKTRFTDLVSLLKTYASSPQADKNYISELTDWVKNTLKHYQAQPEQLTNQRYADLANTIQSHMHSLQAALQTPKAIESPAPSTSSKAETKDVLPPKGQISLNVNIPYAQLTLGNLLGKGAFGVVYQATWRYNPVAIKQLHSHQLSTGAVEEFQRELHVMSQLRSPNIVQFYGATTDQSPYCLVMEYMPKGSLFSVLHSQETLTWPLRETMAVDIAKGLAYLHHENILHRDLKSMNILLDAHYRAKLTDFGLARVKTEVASTSTNSSKAVGTLAWMAPELSKRKVVYTDKADMYSYGMVLWEIASREMPFKDAHNAQMIPQWVSEGEREEIPKETPPKLAKLIRFCWEAAPEKRPSAAQAIELLQEDLVVTEPAAVPTYQDNLASVNSNSNPAYLSNTYSNR